MKAQQNNPTMEDIEALASALKNLQQEKGSDEKDINITKQPTQVDSQ